MTNKLEPTKDPPLQAGGGATSYFPEWSWASLFTLQAADSL